MPELPEVETIRSGLAAVLPGRRIKKFEVRLPKIFQNAGAEGTTRLIGAKVEEVGRRGKTLIIDLSTGMTLLIHLKMTGQLIYRNQGNVKLAGGHPTKDMLQAMPIKWTHAIFRFDDESELFFNDMRQFGYIRLLPTDEVADLPSMKAYGPEPLTPEFTPQQWDAMLKRRPNAKLKPLLLDQTFIAGLGNIYVDESLNLAKLHPLKLAGTLKAAERAALFAAIIYVLKTSLQHGGTSDNTYVTIRGGKGDYLNVARVYHRIGEPCLECGTPITRMVVAGRGTHVCPDCQRAPRNARPSFKTSAKVAKAKVVASR